MQTAKRPLVMLGTLVLLTGYASSPEPGESQPVEVRNPAPTDGSLKTDESVYTATCQGAGYAQRCTVTLELSYTNQTDAAIYFDLCYPDDTTPSYVVRGLTREESAYSPIYACVGHNEFIEVPPGEQRNDVLELSRPNSTDGQTGEPFGVLSGRLQVGYGANSCADEDTSCELPLETATSNIFTMNLPD